MSAIRSSAPPPAARSQPAFTNQIPADRRYWVLATVMLVQFVSILTSTIISTAAPTIVDDLHGLNLYAWLFSSYLLASSVTVPVVGKLSDLFGRRPFYIAGLLLFLIGSAASGFSQNMGRSEEHTSELQSQFHLVCRLLLEKKKKKKKIMIISD